MKPPISEIKIADLQQQITELTAAVKSLATEFGEQTKRNDEKSQAAQERINSLETENTRLKSALEEATKYNGPMEPDVV